MESSLKKWVEDTLKQSVAPLQIIRGGGNNKIYEVTCNDGSRFALKQYGTAEADNLRLKHEYESLSFLNEQNEPQIPKLIAFNTNHHCALYTWIEGQKIETITDKDLEEVIAFITRLKTYSKIIKARQLIPAADHALSVNNTLLQLKRRLARLHTIDDLTLKNFLTTQYLPFYEEIIMQLSKTQIDINKSLSFEQAILSPSDFGFHNILQTQQGPIFIDFEYFGWDDPAAMLAHFLWHPGMTLSKQQKVKFSTMMLTLFKDDPDFKTRFQIFYPLIGLVWVLILLNEFIPILWERRVQSGSVKASELEHKKVLQLNKAEACITQLKAWLEERNDNK